MSKRHRCSPSSDLTIFNWYCAFCGFEIEPETCKSCDGTGALNGITYKSGNCKKCKGTGVTRWKRVVL